ncbi:MAG TPA: hypothetical protein VIG62_21510, partial [Blastocatellia bacterium]
AHFSASLESARLSEANGALIEGPTMLARHVTMTLRADSLKGFMRVIESGVIPLLREQEGFVDQITLISPERAEAIVISFWENKESEEAFNRTRNPEVLRGLLEVIEGTPRVDLFEVASIVSNGSDEGSREAFK